MILYEQFNASQPKISVLSFKAAIKYSGFRFAVLPAESTVFISISPFSEKASKDFIKSDIFIAAKAPEVIYNQGKQFHK